MTRTSTPPPVRVLMATGQSRPEPWVRELAECLPQLEVLAWTPDDAVQADYLVCWGPPAGLFETQHQLKAIFNLGAGVESLLAMPNLPAVPLIRLEDAGMAVQMAEYVCQAVIRFARQLDLYEADTRAGAWTLHKPISRALYPVGVMGLGVLGKRVAQAVAGFDYPVAGWARTPHQIDGVRCYAGADQFDDFLRATRVLVNVLPLTAGTENIMNADTLGKLQAQGHVINVARGAHLVDADLIALLDSGHLAGATLDVFRTEPLPPGHPFWQHPRITLTPHTSARTLRSTSLRQIADNILRMEAGQPVPGIVDRQRGY
jgi:glyoxylate/hydroxypyruvate reductase A